MPDRALLNVINPHLINFYDWLKRGLCLDIRLEHDSRVFYAHRARFNALLKDGETGTREAASLFYYLNRTGYNGLCRFNSRGEFNVPFGKYTRVRFVENFDRYPHVLSSWTFRTGDFEGLPLESDDFIYADPPFDVDFRTYAK